MRRPSLLIRCASLAFAVAGCGAQRAVPHPSTRHARTAAPPSTSPLWVADQYYIESSFPDVRAHATGEFAQRFASQPTLGSLLAPSATVALRTVVERGDSAIIAATVSEPDRKRVTEWYSYLVRGAGAWKMYAIRTVRFDPSYYALLDSLTRGARTPDAPSQVASMTLATESDSALREFVASHTMQLDSLVGAYRTLPGVPATIGVHDAAQPLHRFLVASNASSVARDPAHPGCTFVRINGDERRQVGAFRADAGCRAPSMSPADFIYIEHVQGGWYLYRAL